MLRKREGERMRVCLAMCLMIRVVFLDAFTTRVFRIR